MSDSSVASEQYFNFSESHNYSGDQSALFNQAPIQFDKLTPQVIQQELANGFKVNKEVIAKGGIYPPPVEDIDDKYEDFLNHKAYAFLLLTYHPYFRNKFDYKDIIDVNNLTKQRAQQVSWANIFTILGVFSFERYFLRKKPIFGLTQDSGWAPFLLKYYFLPKLLSNFVDLCLFYPNLQRKTSNILQKYSFDQETQSNPQYRQAFDDLRQYKLNMSIKNQKQ
ncbi:hypothetical protein TTHERM_00586650 (macronuclear) [Tetrahymena thermophila SB210]|uniref:Uncharacterized protein n=1 Tax=Tetrahymena thermophila (strain SB210) TaxID=312017 RepID=I7M8T4_TETTS|nr:hypothetical protein TTHERM_00586650 [Tetrahymena thermophila SB210]EAR99625.1 hypothetical protein TTHERM_00586650 [Tetrahymena thermophila SB210]|eukprot:XP_001019870.1 hypothetical protein TTHERM_00586650 [Tetrahymena thermophila SB210]